MGDWGWVSAAYVTVLGTLGVYAWSLFARLRKVQGADSEDR